jgi:hypothetical protein
LFEVEANLESTGDTFESAPIGWKTEGKVCYGDPKFPCVDFSESGTGVGTFLFFLTADGDYRLGYGAVSSIPESASLWLLATAAGLALLVSRSGRIAHSLL